MNTANLIRDLFEFGMVVALGAMLVSAVLRLKKGRIHPTRCTTCSRLISRVYKQCPHCLKEQGPQHIQSSRIQ